MCISGDTVTLCAPLFRQKNSLDNLSTMRVSSPRLALSFVKVFVLVQATFYSNISVTFHCNGK